MPIESFETPLKHSIVVVVIGVRVGIGWLFPKKIFYSTWWVILPNYNLQEENLLSGKCRNNRQNGHLGGFLNQ